MLQIKLKLFLFFIIYGKIRNLFKLHCYFIKRNGHALLGLMLYPVSSGRHNCFYRVFNEELFQHKIMLNIAF